MAELVAGDEVHRCELLAQQPVVLLRLASHPLVLLIIPRARRGRQRQLLRVPWRLAFCGFDSIDFECLSVVLPVVEGGSGK